MSRPARRLRVLRNELCTPHLRRVVLGGPEIVGFPTDQESAHVKLWFPRDGQAELDPSVNPKELPAADRPDVRAYTLRQFDAERGELTIDFTVHPEGPGAGWSAAARPGDSIVLAGPGATKLVDPGAESFVFAGDMCALPAIAVNLERLPTDAHGIAILEVMSEADRQPLVAPRGVELHWVVQPTPERPNDRLVDAVREHATADRYPHPALWAAGEISSVRAIRRLFRDRWSDPASRYVSSYWQRGRSDEDHRKEKKRESAKGS